MLLGSKAMQPPVRVAFLDWGNQVIFDALLGKKDAIESTFGAELIWERMGDKRMSRIKYEKVGVDIFNEEHWDEMIQFLCTFVPKFEAAFKPHVIAIGKKL